MNTVMSRPGHAALERPNKRPAARPRDSAADPIRAYRSLLDAAARTRQAGPLDLGQLIQALERVPATNVAVIDWDGGVFNPAPGLTWTYPGDLVIEIGVDAQVTVGDVLTALRAPRLPAGTAVYAEWMWRTTDTQVRGVLTAGRVTVIVTDAA
jgi:hypothetical protein